MLWRRGKLRFDQRDVVVGIQYAGLDGAGAAGVFVEIDVELLDGVKERQEILVAGALGEVPCDSFQASVAAVVGWRCQTLCVSLRNLGDGSPGFFGGLSQVLELELGVGLLLQMVGSRSVGGGGQLGSPRAYFGSAGQMAAYALDEFAGKGDPFVEVFGVECLNEGIWVEGLGAGEKSEDPAVFGLEAELQDCFGPCLLRTHPPLFTEGCCLDDGEGGLPCFGTGLGLLSGLGCPDSFTVECFGTVLEFSYGCHGEALYFGRHTAVGRWFDCARTNPCGQPRRCRVSVCPNHLVGANGDGGDCAGGVILRPPGGVATPIRPETMG